MVTIKNAVRFLVCCAAATLLFGAAYAIVLVHKLDATSGLVLGYVAGVCAGRVCITVWEWEKA